MRIIHFHPDARMAMKFVLPLMDAERREGVQSELVSSARRTEIECTIIPFDLSVSNLLGLPFALWRICKYLKALKPDAVFCHNTKSSLLPLIGAWWAGVHVRVYFNHGVPYISYHGILRILLRNLEYCNTALATHVVTVSSYMRVLLMDVNSRINAQIIENGSASGIDLYTFSPERYSRTIWRQSHGLQEKDLVVVFVGRPEKRKGFELVLRLWTEYLHDKNFKLLLCGPRPDDVLKYLSSIPSNIICLGFVDNVPEVLSGSDLMILPSLHEGLSYACLEAQAAGVVIVANDIPGIRCVVENEITGFLVPDNDLVKYTEIIQKIEKNRAYIETIQLKARESVGRFSRKIFIPAYISFLNGLF